MTNEAGLDRYVREYLAQKLGDVNADQVVEFRFDATPGRVWSDYTESSFDCHIIVTTDQVSQDERHVWLSESETCEFLNGYGKAAA